MTKNPAASTPSLVLPATAGTIFTRKNIQEHTSPKGYAELDLRDFGSRLSSYFGLERRRRVKKAREERQAKQNRWATRPFFPQKGIKVERADTNEEAKSRGLIYLTLSNGQVVRPERLFAKGKNPHLITTVFDYLETQKEAA